MKLSIVCPLVLVLAAGAAWCQDAIEPADEDTNLPVEEASGPATSPADLPAEPSGDAPLGPAAEAAPVRSLGGWASVAERVRSAPIGPAPGWIARDHSRERVRHDGRTEREERVVIYVPAPRPRVYVRPWLVPRYVPFHAPYPRWGPRVWWFCF